MWYEMLPFVGLCVGVAAAVQFVHKPFGYFTERGANRPVRFANHPQDGFGFRRDRRLTGSLYGLQGLEVIPDEQ